MRPLASSSSTAASWAGGRPGAGSARSRPVRARHPRAPGLSPQPSRRPRRLRGARGPRRGHARRGAHLVGHSYGGVVSLLAAAAVPERVRSLTVIEPPCTAVAAGNPDADAFTRGGIEWWRNGPTDDPEAFLRGFLEYVGSDTCPRAAPRPAPPGRADVDRRARPVGGRNPARRARCRTLSKLVVSGGHHAAFDAICDVLEVRLPGERLMLPGYGHRAAASRIQRRTSRSSSTGPRLASRKARPLRAGRPAPRPGRSSD